MEVAMPKTSRTDQVRAAPVTQLRVHRNTLRAQGLRQIRIWVPDTSAPGFAEEARRQCELANASVHAKDDQDFVDSVSWLNSDEAR
jgi:hypothetical protein